jgi:hypothetical protein
VSLDADSMISLLEQSMFQMSESVLAAFGTFEGPESDQEAAIQVLAEVIKRAWLRPLMAHQKSFLLDIVLVTLVKGRRQAEVVNRLLVVLRRKFRLIEHLLGEVLVDIKRWLSVRQHIA